MSFQRNSTFVSLPSLHMSFVHSAQVMGTHSCISHQHHGHGSTWNFDLEDFVVFSLKICKIRLKLLPEITSCIITGSWVPQMNWRGQDWAKCIDRYVPSVFIDCPVVFWHMVVLGKLKSPAVSVIDGFQSRLPKLFNQFIVWPQNFNCLQIKKQ